MKNIGTNFSGGLGSAGVAVGLNDHRGIFQHKQFHNSMDYQMLRLSNAEITAYSYLQTKS